MNIIILFAKRKKSLKLSSGPLICVAGTGLTVILAAAFFFSGYQYATNRSAEIVHTVRDQTQSLWASEVSEGLNELKDMKMKAETSLNAMASRLSLLQGHVMRLDALGSRLVTMAELKDIEFGVNNPPGMGGPETALNHHTQKIPDFLVSLNKLEQALRDRQDKLLAMESMLIDRSLQEQTSPAGNPTQGGWLSSLYGYRSDPLTGKREFHQGLDFAGKPETPITAAAAGIVTWSGASYGYGNLVEISHGNGYVTKYAHNMKNLVSVGEKVEKGEVIALMGNSGRSTGTHVHFEVVRNGKHVNPKRYISLQ